MTTDEKLLRLINRRTAYELIAVNDDLSIKALAGYTPQRSKMGILNMLRKNGESWAKRISEKDLLTFEKKGQTAKLGKFTVFFTGRTQRDAILEGELDWFEDIIPISL